MISEHGTHSAYVRGCHCQECTEAHRVANQKSFESLRSAEVTEHGRTGYRYGCRCDVCKAANAAYMRDYRSQQ